MTETKQLCTPAAASVHVIWQFKHPGSLSPLVWWTILGPPHSTQWCSSKRCGQQQEVKLSVWASSSYQGIKFKNMGNDTYAHNQKGG